MLKKILIGGLGLVAALAVIGLLLPRTSHVQRSIEIGRPASVVYAIVDSFQLFDQWSPWQDLDPNMKQTVGGAREGVGATLTWTGNDKVGSGSQVITADVPNRSVESTVDFGSMGVAKATLRLEPVAAGTRVTWMLDSDMGAGPIGHYFGLMMDRMIGQDYAHGLEKLKRLAENMPDVDIAGFDVHAVQVAGRPILMVRRSTGADVSSIAKAYADGYAEIRKFMTARKLKQAGPPMGIDGDMRDKSFTFDAALPVDRGAVSGGGAGDVRLAQSYTGSALRTVHLGPYDTLGQTYGKMRAYMMAHGYGAKGPSFSIYIDDPAVTPAPQLRTEIYWPLQ